MVICDICKKEFTSDRSLILHKRLSHKIIKDCCSKNANKIPSIISKIKKTKVKNKIKNTKRDKKHKSLLEKFIKDYMILNNDKKYNTDNTYDITCGICGSSVRVSFRSGNIPRCSKCFPIHRKFKSACELDLYNIVKEYYPDAKSGDRSILNNRLELDIYVPSKNIAIEFDGLYWHSENNGNKDNKYHLSKTTDCINKGVRLIHIFEDEWKFKKNIVTSIVKSKLGIYDKYIDSNQCKVKNVNINDSVKFLNNNHLQGYTEGKNLGLYYNNEIVCILTYGKPRSDNNHDCEIYRFCNKLGVNVKNGFDLLMSKINSKSVISYVDKRYYTGNSYKKSGFKLIRETDPLYYYVVDGRRVDLRYIKNRGIYTYDDNISEYDNMINNGYDRIWDCGYYVFERIE